MKPLPLPGALLILGCARAPAQNNQAGGPGGTVAKQTVIMDGGCGVVTSTCGVVTQRIENVACNGQA